MAIEKARNDEEILNRLIKIRANAYKKEGSYEDSYIFLMNEIDCLIDNLEDMKYFKICPDCKKEEKRGENAL